MMIKKRKVRVYGSLSDKIRSLLRLNPCNDVFAEEFLSIGARNPHYKTLLGLTAVFV